MNEMKFEWDLNKALTNVKKHGVSFEEASTVFDDENAILFDDPDHSESEERFMLLWLSIEANMLIVCHCVRKEGSIIRIVSARRATKSETKQYIDIVKGW